jgi:uncharacterized protein (TIGR03790 family)
LARLVLLGVFFCAVSPRKLYALQPDELLLICNSNAPAGVKTAEFYAKARLVPDGRIFSLAFPVLETMGSTDFQASWAGGIRDFLRKNKLESKVKCLVTFQGVPLRVGAQPVTDADQREIIELRHQLDADVKQMEPLAADMESLAKELDPSFHPGAGAGGAAAAGAGGGGRLEAMAEQTARAMHAIAQKLPPPEDPRREAMFARLLKVVRVFGGDAELLSKFSDEELNRVIPGKWAERRAALEKDQREMNQLQDKPFDPAARKRLRELMSQGFGLYSTGLLLRMQAQYLAADDTPSSFDNELALLWWGYYPRAKWMPNPLNYKFRGTSRPVMMVSRLDGPQDGTAVQIILSSLKAERDGLRGRVVVDSSGGTGPGGGAGPGGAFAAFDQTLLNLAHLVQSKTKLSLVLDTNPKVLPPHSVKDVALYCGWYSVKKYVPACDFKPGAVAYHVASFELMSLRNPADKGWVAGLLDDGAAASIGSVAEPYLSAFPQPDEFFPLLMTGKLTLAEAYWATLPQTSWQMALIGDPLYRPFAKNPQLKAQDLPEGLRKFVEQTTAATQATVQGAATQGTASTQPAN